jgi:multidrug transporter EmrE-like cation transporter
MNSVQFTKNTPELLAIGPVAVIVYSLTPVTERITVEPSVTVWNAVAFCTIAGATWYLDPLKMKKPEVIELTE